MAKATRDLANVLLASQRMDDARVSLDEAEVVLGEIGDVYELSIARCIRGRLLIAQGNSDRARGLLSTVQTVARQYDTTPESDLGLAITELQAALS